MNMNRGKEGGVWRGVAFWLSRVRGERRSVCLVGRVNKDKDKVKI